VWRKDRVHLMSLPETESGALNQFAACSGVADQANFTGKYFLPLSRYCVSDYGAATAEPADGAHPTDGDATSLIPRSGRS
jgi:hypothetical protein